MDGDQVAFDDSTVKAGDDLASYIVHPRRGDRGDVKVGYRCENGVWTQQFNDKDETDYFGIAAFDNAQVRHAVASDVQKLGIAR